MSRSKVDGSGSAPAGSPLHSSRDASSHAGMPSAATSQAALIEPLLSVTGLGLRAGGLPDGRLLFERLGFDVRAGECWVVLGPNGSGKSSLLAALAGVFERASGEVVIDGQALDAWKPDALADRRAWCPQFWSDPFPSSVLDTVQLARNRHDAWLFETPEPDDAVQGLMARLELVELASADVRTLSGGERQRVAIATALLQDAPLLLLDEPASHLDLGHQQLLVDVLRGHADSGGAVVVSLHDLNLAWDLADHVVLLDGRGGAAAGPRAAMMKPARLGAAFGVAIQQVAVASQQRFWSGLRGEEADR
jgi:iron complex transport system ATP-binding protein